MSIENKEGFPNPQLETLKRQVQRLIELEDLQDKVDEIGFNFRDFMSGFDHLISEAGTRDDTEFKYKDVLERFKVLQDTFAVLGLEINFKK